MREDRVVDATPTRPSRCVHVLFTARYADITTMTNIPGVRQAARTTV
jgi:hypothetical protein